MPLGNRASRRGEHVGPVPQLGATGATADDDAPDWVVVADLDPECFNILSTTSLSIPCHSRAR